MKVFKLMWHDFLSSMFYYKLEKFFKDFAKLFLVLTPIGFVVLKIIEYFGHQVLIDGAPIIGWIIISFVLGFVGLAFSAAIFIISISIFYIVAGIPGSIRRVVNYFKDLKDRVE